LSVPESELRPENDLPRPVAPELPDDPVATWPHLRRVGGPESLADYLRGVWRWRDFLVRIALAERRAQNQDSVLGQLWNLLNPLLLIAVYYLIFGVVLGVESRRGVDHYLPFLIVGIIAFDYTRSTAQAGGQTMLKHRRLLQSISFPRAVMPLSALVSETLSYLYAIPVMLLLASLAPGGPRPMATWLLLAPILVVQGCFNLGVMMIVARIACPVPRHHPVPPLRAAAAAVRVRRADPDQRRADHQRPAAHRPRAQPDLQPGRDGPRRGALRLRRAADLGGRTVWAAVTLAVGFWCSAGVSTSTAMTDASTLAPTAVDLVDPAVIVDHVDVTYHLYADEQRRLTSMPSVAAPAGCTARSGRSRTSASPPSAARPSG
jgi:hypothetical protein